MATTISYEENSMLTNGTDGVKHVIADVQGPDAPIPQISDLDLQTVNSDKQLVADIIRSMKLTGACIVRNMVGKPALDEIEAHIRPYLDSASEWKGDFYPPESRRVTGCMTKSSSYAINIVGHPIWQAVGNHFLTSRLQWVGSQNEQSTSLPQLNNTIVFSIFPGGHVQELHRDDSTHHNDQRGAPVHHLGRDTGATMFVAAKPSTRQNGATRFIPGSHLWDYSIPPPANDSPEGRRLIQYAELRPGDAFLMLSGCIHGAGANTTQNEERLIYSAATVRGWLRQEENQYLTYANEMDKIKELPVELQRLAGWSVSRPTLGWVNFDDPIGILGGKEMEGTEDLF